MSSIMDMLREGGRARLFFVAHAQSAVGTGLGYVALLVVAFDRHPAPWSITLVLLAEFLPATVGGPLFGAAADRWSRRTCAVVAEVARAVAFVGIAFVDGIEATVLLALVAGFGAGLFQPAILAGLPMLFDRSRLPAAMSLYGALNEIGTTLGPALAALVLLVMGPETLLLVNGLSFAASALLIAVLPFGGRTREDDQHHSLLREARDGLAAARRVPGVRVVISVSAAALLCAGMLNVVELLYARGDLDVGDSGFSILVALTGLGLVLGNARGSRGGTLSDMTRRYLAGVVLLGAALIALSIVPSFALAAVAFIVFGFGNGLVLVHGRLLLQSIVPEGMLGRIYGIKDAVLSTAFSIAFIGAGALVEVFGTRAVMAAGGVGSLVVWALAAPVLRRELPLHAEPLPAEPRG
jgi:MFS family permease